MPKGRVATQRPSKQNKNRQVWTFQLAFCKAESVKTDAMNSSNDFVSQNASHHCSPQAINICFAIWKKWSNTKRSKRKYFTLDYKVFEIRLTYGTKITAHNDAEILPYTLELTSKLAAAEFQSSKSIQYSFEKRGGRKMLPSFKDVLRKNWYYFIKNKRLKVFHMQSVPEKLRRSKDN